MRDGDDGDQVERGETKWRAQTRQPAQSHSHTERKRWNYREAVMMMMTQLAERRDRALHAQMQPSTHFVVLLLCSAAPFLSPSASILCILVSHITPSVVADLFLSQWVWSNLASLLSDCFSLLSFLHLFRCQLQQQNASLPVSAVALSVPDLLFLVEALARQFRHVAWRWLFSPSSFPRNILSHHLIAPFAVCYLFFGSPCRAISPRFLAIALLCCSFLPHELIKLSVPFHRPLLTLCCTFCS